MKLKVTIAAVLLSVLSLSAQDGACASAPIPESVAASTASGQTDVKSLPAKEKEKRMRMKGKRPNRKETDFSLHKGKNSNETIAFKNSPSFKNSTVARASASAKIMGNLVYTDDWDTDKGICEFSLTDGAATNLVKKWDLYANGGCVLVNDKYYTTYFDGYDYVEHAVWNTKDWSNTTEYGSVENVASDLAYDPVSNQVYGTFYTADQKGFELGILDLNTWKRTKICSVDNFWFGIAFDKNGQMFAIDHDGNFIKVDKSTGNTLIITPAVCEPLYNSSATIDARTGIMYFNCVNADGSSMYSIDTATGKATKLFNFKYNEQIMGMWVPAPEAEDGAPAAVTDLKVEFGLDALAGSVSFKMPSQLFGGAEATGKANYTVKFNDKVVATGSASYSEDVRLNVALDKSGEYEVVVFASNEAGEGAKTTLSAGWLGPDAPGAPENLKAQWAAGQLTLNWTAPQAKVHGGEIDESLLSYTIVCTNDSSVKADKIKGTSVSFPLAEPDSLTTYSYVVTATINSTSSLPSKPAAISLGTIYPPFSETFDSEAEMAKYTILESASDPGNGWSYYSENVRKHYSTEAKADDWLITPAISIEANKRYELTFDTWSHTAYDEEQLEVYIGTSPDRAGMTKCLVEPMTVAYKASNRKNISAFISGLPAGKYYIGFHAISEPDSYYLYLDNIKVSEGVSVLAPAAPASLDVKPDTNGALRAEITVTAPTQSISGEPLSALTSLTLRRDGIVVKEFNNPAPGATLTFSDTTEEDGKYSYSASATNEYGVSDEASASAFIGVNIPAAVASLNVRESNPGTAVLTWDKVTTDIDGMPLNPELVNYTLFRMTNDLEIIASDLTANTYTDKPVADGSQAFVTYYIMATTRSGYSGETASDICAIGTPYAMPFRESAAGGKLSNPIADTYDEYVAWGLATDNTFSGVSSADGDNGFFFMQGSFQGDEASLYFPKVKIDGKNPTLQFSYRPIAPFEDYDEDDEPYMVYDLNEVRVEVNAGSGWELLKTVSQNSDAVWTKCNLDLQRFSGKEVSVRLTGIVNTMVYVLVDNVFILNLVDHNLSLANVKAPKRAHMDETFAFDFTVENNGLLDCDGYTVNVKSDGKTLKTLSGTSLAAGARSDFSVTAAGKATDADVANFTLEVDYAADMELSDNEKNLAVEMIHSKLPAPASAVYRTNNGTTTLEWTQPVIAETYYAPHLEDFENPTYEAFTIQDFGPWTLRNFNNSKTYGIANSDNTDVLKYPNACSPMAYQLFSYSASGTTKAKWEGYAHSDRMLVAFDAVNGPNDGWLISPELSGEQQSVTFRAKSTNVAFGNETFEVLYSDTDAATESFEGIEVEGYKNGVPGEWTEYCVNLPLGAKYFAIRCTSDDVEALAIDNIHYTPASGLSELSLAGYNVYLNGEKLNSEPIKATTFSVESPKANDGEFKVSAVYQLGESKAVEATDDSGVEIVVSDVEGMILYDLQGRRVHNPAKGIYIEVSKGTARKVIIR